MAASNPRWCSVEAVIELCQWLPAHAPIWGVVKQNALVTLHRHRVAAKHEVKLNQHGGCQVQIPCDQHTSAALMKESNISTGRKKALMKASNISTGMEKALMNEITHLQKGKSADERKQYIYRLMKESDISTD